MKHIISIIALFISSVYCCHAFEDSDWTYCREIGISFPDHADLIKEYHYAGDLSGDYDTLQFDIQLSTGISYFAPFGPILKEYGYVDNFSEPFFVFSNFSSTYTYLNSEIYVSNSNILEVVHLEDSEHSFFPINSIYDEIVTISGEEPNDLVSIKIQKIDDCYTVSYLIYGSMYSQRIYTDAEFDPYFAVSSYNSEYLLLENLKLYNSQIPEPLHYGIVFAFISLVYLALKRK